MIRKIKYLRIFILLLLSFPLFCYPQISVDLNPLKGAIVQTTVSVGTSVTALPATALSGRKNILIKNTHATAILYIGSSTTTADTTSPGGTQIAAGEFHTVDISDDVVLYGIAASGTIYVNTLEVR